MWYFLNLGISWKICIFLLFYVFFVVLCIFLLFYVFFVVLCIFCCSMYFLCFFLFYVFFVLFYVFCVVLCIVCVVSFSVFFCVYMYTVLLPSGSYPVAVKYIISKTYVNPVVCTHFWIGAMSGWPFSFLLCREYEGEGGSGGNIRQNIRRLQPGLNPRSWVNGHQSRCGLCAGLHLLLSTPQFLVCQVHFLILHEYIAWRSLDTSLLFPPKQHFLTPCLTISKFSHRQTIMKTLCVHVSCRVVFLWQSTA